MKPKINCFSCEAQGITKPADTEVYIDAIREIAPVCHECLKEIIEESVALDDEEDDFVNEEYYL